MKPKGCTEARNSSGRKDSTRVTCHQPQHRSSPWVSPRFYVKEVHLLILKHWLEGRGPVRTLSGVEAGGYSALPLPCWGWWAPSFPSSPKAMVFRPLLSSRAPVSPEGSFYLHVLPWFCIWCPGFSSCRRQTLLDCLAQGWEGEGALHPWIPWGCNNWRDNSCQTTTPKALCRQQTEIHPGSFWGRGSFVWPRASAWKAGFRSGMPLEVCRAALG